jgi:hypothetical protein
MGAQLEGEKIYRSAQDIAKPSLKPAEGVTVEDFDKLATHGHDVASKAMELTDAWGAMFVIDRQTLHDVCTTLGFREDVSTTLYDKGVALSDVQERGYDGVERSVFTWHKPDAALLTLRGAVDLGVAMADVTDESLDRLISENLDLFNKVMTVLPEYTHHHMFSPKVASNVLGVFGARVSPATMYRLAPKYGTCVSVDLEGRQGVSTQFIRSVTLTLSARLS